MCVSTVCTLSTACSVGSFGAKFLLFLICIFKYINVFILLEWNCLSWDLPDVIIYICAGQLWTIGKIWTASKNRVLQILSCSSPSSDSSSLRGPSPNLPPNLCYDLRALIYTCCFSTLTSPSAVHTVSNRLVPVVIIIKAHWLVFRANCG